MDLYGRLYIPNVLTYPTCSSPSAATSCRLMKSLYSATIASSKATLLTVNFVFNNEILNYPRLQLNGKQVRIKRGANPYCL